MKYTGGTLDIFMSSDGESIPFGRNWVHKIEEGLNSASIMFVFVTPTSINSNWIYFEAGFAYSKDIEVIPVALGVDIGLLKAPLNLLQGFNLTSSDSLNNFISVINRKFNFSFDEKFNVDDYNSIDNKMTDDNQNIDLSDYFSKARFKLHSKYKDNDGKNIDRNLSNQYLNIVERLKVLDLKYSMSKFYDRKILIVAGIKIIYKFSENLAFDGDEYIDFKISIYNLEKSIEIMNEIFDVLENVKSNYLWFDHSEKYNYITDDEDISSLMYADDKFVNTYDESASVHSYKTARFSIFDASRNYRSKVNNEVLSVYFESGKFQIEVFIDLVEYLLKKKIIHSNVKN